MVKEGGEAVTWSDADNGGDVSAVTDKLFAGSLSFTAPAEF